MYTGEDLSESCKSEIFKDVFKIDHILPHGSFIWTAEGTNKNWIKLENRYLNIFEWIDVHKQLRIVSNLLIGLLKYCLQRQVLLFKK